MRNKDTKLLKLYNLLGYLPSEEQMDKWDIEINKVLQNRESYKRITRNIRLLMIICDLNVAQLGLATGYDPAHISKIINGTTELSSNVVCFCLVAAILKVKIEVILGQNLRDDLITLVKNY